MNNPTQSDTIASLLGPNADPVAAGWHLRRLVEDADESGPVLVDEILRQADLLAVSDPAILGGLLRAIHTLLIRPGPDSVVALNPTPLAALRRALPASAPNQHLLLHLLAMIRSKESLEILVQELTSTPPTGWLEGAQILSPLMQHQDWPVEAVFPAALACLQYPALAAPLLDLANYLTRKSRVKQHPAAAHQSMLNRLLGEVSGRLGQFENDPRTFGDDVDKVQAMLGEAVALAVSLCDAVGLIGDDSAIGKLNQTVDLRHRRVQCEAAGALAKLGDELGKKRLLDLTADPAARLRAIHYADELGFGELVEEQYRSDNATAEAELSLWLSQPQQMGVPPTAIEVIDSRRMLWPSFNDPLDVFLVQFEYSFGDRKYSNVGIAGPVTFALSADVAELPVNDIYAIYA
ncbi:MAG: HEAT repeat domain-containing protein, partial [Pirellulales bacterium]|nr:HEAT repeat domain-containing protein [Pirellulales bacterium]